MKSTIKILLVLFIALAISFSVYAQQQVPKQLKTQQKLQKKLVVVKPNYNIIIESICPCKDRIEAEGGILLYNLIVLLYDSSAAYPHSEPVHVIVKYKIFGVGSSQIETKNIYLTLKKVPKSTGPGMIWKASTKLVTLLLIDKAYGLRFYIGEKEWAFNSCPYEVPR